MAQFPRISGRVGQTIILDNTFYHAGIAAEPYAVRRIEIYKSSVRDENLVTVIPISYPHDSEYPFPLERVNDRPGYLRLPWAVPVDLSAPAAYFDKWVFIPDDVYSSGGTEVDPDDPSIQQEKCSRFWLYPDQWFVDDGLETVRFGFEPLDSKFNKGDKRMLEVGLMPLPLYDYDHNLVVPLIPFLQGFIHIETQNCEIIVDKEPMTIGIRQGSYRSNPFVMKSLIDTSGFLIGTYKYYVSIEMPNGQVLRSNEFHFTIGG
jgi:hypothetical protein